MADKSPAFQFYPKDFLTDGKVIVMSPEIRGLYINLLCIDWLEDGFPEKSMLTLAGYVWHDQHGNLRDDDGDGTAIALLSACFIAHPSKPGFITNPRLQKERKGQEERRLEKIKAGRQGAKSRWNRDLQPMADPSICHKSANGKAIANDSSSSSSSSAINNNITLPVADLAEREEPGSKIVTEEPDPLLEIARSKLVAPTGSHPWETSNPFILTGRQPLRRFPEVFLSPTELRDVIALYDGAGIEHLLGHAFKAVVGRLQQMKMDGKDTARAPCCSWLIGWAYQEQLENHNKTLRIEKTKRPYEQR